MVSIVVIFLRFIQLQLFSPEMLLFAKVLIMSKINVIFLVHFDFAKKT